MNADAAVEVAERVLAFGQKRVTEPVLEFNGYKVQRGGHSNEVIVRDTENVDGRVIQSQPMRQWLEAALAEAAKQTAPAFAAALFTGLAVIATTAWLANIAVQRGWF